MTQTLMPYGVRHAVSVDPVPVDPAALIYDNGQQINLIRDGGVLVPALKHSSGTTGTSTASSDSTPADSDSDQTTD